LWISIKKIMYYFLYKLLILPNKKNVMKSFIFGIITIVVLSLLSCDEITDQLTNGDLTNEEVVQGLKEALVVGTDSSTLIAHKVNGYYDNLKIKIPFPEDAQRAETALRNLGMNALVDTFILKLNRAAEDAADDAKSIFINSILNMSFTDALNILYGSDDAATQYLKASCWDTLKIIFKTPVDKSLKSVGASQSWYTISSTYNALPLVTPVNTDLTDYTTTKALNGLFTLIAEEELKIRKDPVARVTDILQKVFSKLD
jgi:hypothetical protein